MAVVRVAGVGALYDAANNSPVTCCDDENNPVGESVRENPTRPVAAMGLTPTLPAID